MVFLVRVQLPGASAGSGVAATASPVAPASCERLRVRARSGSACDYRLLAPPKGRFGRIGMLAHPLPEGQV